MTLTTPYDENGLPQASSLTSYYTFASLSAGFGGAYEVTGSNVRKYYSFAGQMIATLAPGASAGVNDGTGLKYFLTDHLGSMVATLAPGPSAGVTDDVGT